MGNVEGWGDVSCEKAPCDHEGIPNMEASTKAAKSNIIGVEIVKNMFTDFHANHVDTRNAHKPSRPWPRRRDGVGSGAPGVAFAGAGV